MSLTPIKKRARSAVLFPDEKDPWHLSSLLSKLDPSSNPRITSGLPLQSIPPSHLLPFMKWSQSQLHLSSSWHGTSSKLFPWVSMCATGACTQCSQNSLCQGNTGELMMLMTGCYLLDTLGETSSSTLQCFCWGGGADCQDMFPNVSLFPQILLLSQDHSRPGKRQSLPGECAWAVFMHCLIASTFLQLHLGQGGTEGPKSECTHRHTDTHMHMCPVIIQGTV